MTFAIRHRTPPPPLMALFPSIFTPGKGPKNTSFIKEIFVNCRPPSTFNFFVAFRRKSFFKANKKHILVCFGNPEPPPLTLRSAFCDFFVFTFWPFMFSHLRDIGMDEFEAILYQIFNLEEVCRYQNVRHSIRIQWLHLNDIWPSGILKVHLSLNM